MVIHDERMTLGEVILTTMFNCFGDPFYDYGNCCGVLLRFAYYCTVRTVLLLTSTRQASPQTQSHIFFIPEDAKPPAPP